MPSTCAVLVRELARACHCEFVTHQERDVSVFEEVRVMLREGIINSWVRAGGCRACTRFTRQRLHSPRLGGILKDLLGLYVGCYRLK